MIPFEEFLPAIETVVELFRKVNTLYIRKIAEQIKTIGELTPSSIHTLDVIREMGANVSEIKTQLADATKLGRQGVEQILERAAESAYAKPTAEGYIADKSIPPEANERLMRFTATAVRQTAGALTNLSNTTVIDGKYKEAIDVASAAVASGGTGYQEEIRRVLTEIGGAGIQVEYESGHRRRLDTAVRMNVTNATLQLQQQAAFLLADAMGDDAFEISAHKMSAPDHEPVQGHVFLRVEFDKMQVGQDFSDIDGHRYEGFRRPIREWNCSHFASPFNTKTSIRTYTDEALEQYRRENHKGCVIGGKHYTTYQASQLMRRLETEIRRQKDIRYAAQTAGDEELAKGALTKMRAVSAQYTAVAKASGLRERRDRTAITVKGKQL